MWKATSFQSLQAWSLQPGIKRHATIAGNSFELRGYSLLVIDDDLERLYRSKWDGLCEVISSGCGISDPLLAAVPPEYEKAKTRLLIVGKETYGWASWYDESNVDRIVALRERYRSFDRGRKHNSPFFQAASELQLLLNPGADPFGFMWLNLFVCDQNKTTPREPAAEALRNVSFLRDEIKILRPDAVVFFTGHGAYNYTITHKKYFPDANFTAHSNLWSKVRAEGLPTKTVRTYHPSYLRRQRHFGVLKEIASWILEPT